MSDKATTGKRRGRKPKETKKRVRKAQKPPFRVMLGRVSANGKGYDFERHAFKAADEAMASVQTAIDKDDDRLREVMILIHPQEA